MQNPDFLKFYHEELNYLRKQGEAFAFHYPQMGGHLFSETAESDSFESRLIESFAFLTARLRCQLRDETANMTDELIRLFCPHYFLPMPAFGTAQFSPKVSLDQPYHIPRGNEIELLAHDGTACRFTTGYETIVSPIKLTEAVYSWKCLIKPRDFSAKSIRSCLKFQLQSVRKDLPLQFVLPDTLRFFIQADLKDVYQIYELLMTHVKEAVLTFKKGEKTHQVILPISFIQSIGFSNDNFLLPFPSQSFSGFQLLSEFFYYPERFFYMDLMGLSQWLPEEAIGSIELFFLMDHGYSELESVISADNFLLNCCPIINLFELAGEPIRVDHHQEAYQVIPDFRHNLEAVEIYRIRSMAVINHAQKENIGCVPFGGEYFAGKTKNILYWHEYRRNCFEMGAYQVKGDEVFIRLTDKNVGLNFDKSMIIEPTLFCTNRDKARQLSFSAEKPVCRFLHDGHECVEKIRCVQPIKPVGYQSKAFERQCDLMAHLQINYCGFDNGDKNLSVLKQVLLLHMPNAKPLKTLVENGLISVQIKPTIARHPADFKQAFCYGAEYCLTIDPTHFLNNEIYLFGEMVHEFLSRNAAINTFVVLVLLDENQEEIFKWPAKLGRQTML